MAYKGGLRKWFGEQWVDVSTGQPCGRKDARAKGEEVPCLSPEGCGPDYECFRKERNDFFTEVNRLAEEREANKRKMDDNP